MSPEAAPRLVACCMGLGGFGVAIVAGLFAGTETDVVLLRAIICLIACNVVGFVMGLIGERAIRERIESYAHEHPAPGDEGPVATVAPDATEERVGEAA